MQVNKSLMAVHTNEWGETNPGVWKGDPQRFHINICMRSIFLPGMILSSICNLLITYMQHVS